MTPVKSDQDKIELDRLYRENMNLAYRQMQIIKGPSFTFNDFLEAISSPLDLDELTGCDCALVS
jgi:hypothetical protein